MNFRLGIDIYSENNVITRLTSPLFFIKSKKTLRMKKDKNKKSYELEKIKKKKKEKIYDKEEIESIVENVNRNIEIINSLNCV
jgi:hypothetical protein